MAEKKPISQEESHPKQKAKPARRGLWKGKAAPAAEEPAAAVAVAEAPKAKPARRKNAKAKVKGAEQAAPKAEASAKAEKPAKAAKSKAAKTTKAKAEKPAKSKAKAEKPAKAKAETVAVSAPKKGKGRGKQAQPQLPEGKLKIIPLGGLNEIGKNMTVVEYGDDIIVIDAGMTFPDDELLGVDLVIPDTTYLQKNIDRVRGIFITHGHEDHIGGLPYVLREVNVPIHCTALTAGILQVKLKEHPNLNKVTMKVHKDGDKVKAGCFTVEFIHVNHSIPDACAFCIHTPLGNVVFTGDFKIDTTPVDGKVIDLERFGQLGREGVLLLCADSTNAERPGIAQSEQKVRNSFEREFKNCDKRIIVATFASNVHRIQEIINVAVRSGRKVAVSGRSMENILKVGAELGYITPPPGTLVDLKEIHKYSNDRLVIITTGSQGEPMSALYRMAYSNHRQVQVGYGDKILIAASPIPGNEKPVYGMINELIRKGAEVVYERLADMHVSGHACQEEIKLILALTRPKYYMPVHGEYRHLKMNAGLGLACGVESNNIFISDIGKVLELSAQGAEFNGTVPSGRVLVDGYGVGDVGAAVLRERKSLSESGVITAVAVVDIKNGLILSNPEIISRGFIFVREAEELMEEMRLIARETLESCLDKRMTSRNAIKEAISRKLSDYLFRKTKREPLIVPILIEM